MTVTILLDVMLDGYFLCQLQYQEEIRKYIVGGAEIPIPDKHKLRRFVLSRKPFLKGRKYTINETSQRIINE